MIFCTVGKIRQTGILMDAEGGMVMCCTKGFMAQFNFVYQCDTCTAKRETQNTIWCKNKTNFGLIAKATGLQ